MDELKIDIKEKSEEFNPKILTYKKPEFFTTLIGKENGINLEEENGAQEDDFMSIKNISTTQKNICQRCNTGDNVLSFNNYKNILDYLSKKNFMNLKNFPLDENLKFDSPKIICLNCLLTISKNRTEFEKFFTSNNFKINDVDDNPFSDLIDNPNLKIFNNKETKEDKTKNKNGMNDIFRAIFEKLNSKNTKIPSIFSSASNNNIFNNPINLDYFNILNYLSLPAINYIIPMNQNISNLNIPNYFNNYSNILQNSLLNNPLGLFNLNNNDILNIYKLPELNKNLSIEKSTNNNKSPNLIMNIINKKNNKEKISNFLNENFEQKNIFENFTIIQNKDFDEIFQNSNKLFHLLLDIKICRDSDLFIKKMFFKDS